MDDIGHCQKWEVGDLAIIDNLAVAHYADAGTQQNPKVGLRILHRTTIQGETMPCKADGRKSRRVAENIFSVDRPNPRP
ncbi:hypothetical protein CYMTET_41275 [Cymbomonas tetramitiformis]|uniref:TauD/TfdA-like domain-containing protein n=1 Tax=Cymbomonas tetramitiformis TaxID=36881 RepID=A0AAE0C8G0_9CHLO|nr:hypothetical protein CYMTET_41275 [Cymbomonas tetramitiformis]